MQPVLSVVIPTIGTRELLTDAVASARPGGPVEVLVEVDGPTLEVDLPSEGVTVNVTDQPQGGPSGPRNAGLARARGEWVIFLDDDDLLGSDRIAGDLAALRADPSTDVRLWQSSDDDRDPDATPATTVERARAGRLLTSSLLHIGAVTIRRSLAPRFDEQIVGCEDLNWWCRIQPLLTERVDTDPRHGYRRRAHDGARLIEATAERVQGRLRTIEHFGAAMSREELRFQLRLTAGLAAGLGDRRLALRLFARALGLGDVKSLGHALWTTWRP